MGNAPSGKADGEPTWGTLRKAPRTDPRLGSNLSRLHGDGMERLSGGGEDSLVSAWLDQRRVGEFLGRAYVKDYKPLNLIWDRHQYFTHTPNYELAADKRCRLCARTYLT